MKPVLQISELTKRFDDFVAVNNVSIDVEEGSFFSILGPSGCGKTTLLRMIAGFLEPSSGSLVIRDTDMAGVAPNRRPVNLVFQNLALFPMMNVAENIAFGLKRQKKSRAEIGRKVDSILERVGLSGYGQKEVAQLSGGQKQRVAIARSLVLDPSILLLDEPLGALDLKLREQMKIELKKLQAEIGTTFIYITHDQSEALVMSDRVAVMNKGQFEQVDSPQNLYAKPVTAFVAGFVGENNLLPVQKVETASRFTVRSEMGVEFASTPIGEVRGNAKLYIRPEAIIINPDGALTELNTFELTVRNILFDGANSKILASLNNSNQEIAVALPQNKQFSHIAPGDVLSAGVHPSDCCCYPSVSGGSA